MTKPQTDEFLYEAHEARGKEAKVSITAKSFAHASDDLDYALIVLPLLALQQVKRIVELNFRMSVDAIAHTVKQGPVMISTGTTGVIKGTLLQNPFYTKLPQSSHYQELWPVRMERSIGDCDYYLLHLRMLTLQQYLEIAALLLSINSHAKCMVILWREILSADWPFLFQHPSYSKISKGFSNASQSFQRQAHRHRGVYSMIYGFRPIQCQILQAFRHGYATHYIRSSETYAMRNLK